MRTTWMGALAALSALALAAQACADPETGGAAGDVIDVEGLPLLRAVEDLRIGSLDDPDLGFSSVGGLSLDRDGQLYVFDRQDARIRVYGADGTPLRTIGRRGQGPGEFQGAAVRFGVLGDTVWATENVGPYGARTHLFTRNGTHLSTAAVQGVLVPMQSPPNQVGVLLPASMPDPAYFQGEMLAYVTGGNQPQSGAAPTDTIMIPRVRFRADGSGVDTADFVAQPPAVSPPVRELVIGGDRYRVPAGPGDQSFVLTLPDGRLVVERAAATTPQPATFRLVRLGSAGDTVVRRSYRYLPKPYVEAPSNVDLMVWGAIRRPVGTTGVARPMPADSMAHFRAVRDAVEFLPFQPPVQLMRRGEDGRFWLRREDTSAEWVHWMILESDGTPVGALDLPRDQAIHWSAGEVLWTVETDALGVPWVLRHRLVGAGG